MQLSYQLAEQLVEVSDQPQNGKQRSSRLTVWVLGPCPYGCAYGAGPPSNKEKMVLCGRGGMIYSSPRLSGVVLVIVLFSNASGGPVPKVVLQALSMTVHEFWQNL